jgi:hypothetical protein
MKKLVIGCVSILIAGVVLLSVIALLLETNPPITQEPPWDSPQTRALAVRACFDCHSNQTKWPWFTRVPVGSWIAASDTLEGRGALNFSEWGASGQGREGNSASEVQRTIDRGSMPPNLYLTMHPEAVLTPAEKQQLITGLQNSLK